MTYPAGGRVNTSQVFTASGDASDDHQVESVTVTVCGSACAVDPLPGRGTPSTTWSATCAAPSTVMPCELRAFATDNVPQSGMPVVVTLYLSPSAPPVPTYGSCQVSGASGAAGPVGVSLTFNGFSLGVSGASFDCGNGNSATGVSCGSGSSGACSGTCSYPMAGRFTLGGSVRSGADSFPCGNSPDNAVISLASTPTPTPTATPLPTATPAPACSVRSASGTAGSITVSIDYGGMTVSSSSIDCGNGNSATGVSCAGGVCSGTCAYPRAGRFTARALLNDRDCTNSLNNVVVSPAATPVSTAAATVMATVAPAATASPAPGGFLAPREPDANISVGESVVSPRVTIENVPTSISTVVSSDQPVRNVSCDSPRDNEDSLCSCSLSVQGTQGNVTSYIADCTVSPPVRGRYLMRLTNAQGRTKDVEFILTPGEEAVVQPVQRGPDWTFYAIAAVALLLFVAMVYFAAMKLEEIITYKERLLEKKQGILNDMKMLKYRLMKRELDELAYKKAWDAKEKELAEVEARIAEAEKKEKAKPAGQKGEASP
ncbi:MAG: hypothetical protein AB1626_01055 [Candidatus Micrarchaeota archaeon]